MKRREQILRDLIGRFPSAYGAKTLSEPIKNQLVRQVASDFTSELALDLSPFTQPERKREMTVLANYIATLNLIEDQHEILAKPYGIGSAATLLITTFVLSQLRDRKKSLDLKTISAIMALSVLTTAILVGIYRAMEAREHHNKILKVKLERLMDDKKKHTKGKLRQIVEHTNYTTQFKARLASVFINGVSNRALNVITAGLQSEIEKSQLALLNAKLAHGRGQDIKVSEEDSWFERELQVDTARIEELILAAIEQLNKDKANATRERKRALDEMTKFIGRDTSYLVRHFEELMRDFNKQIYFKIADRSDLREQVEMLQQADATEDS